MLQRQQEKAARQKMQLTPEEALEEVVADSMESMLQSGNVTNMLGKLRRQDMPLHRKVTSWLADTTSNLRSAVDAYSTLTPDTPEGRAVAQMTDAVGKLENTYAHALAEAGENFRRAIPNETLTNVDVLKFMPRENTNIPYRKYRELLNKKAINTTRKDVAKVADARVEAYRGMSDDDIFDIDFLSIAEYNKLNTAHVYTVRNYDKDSFEIVKKEKARGRYEGYRMEDNNGGYGRGTEAGESSISGNDRERRSKGMGRPSDVSHGVDGGIGRINERSEAIQGIAGTDGSMVGDMHRTGRGRGGDLDPSKSKNSLREQAVDRQYTRWAQETEAAKHMYGDFDLGTELQNPEFRKLLQSGISVPDAYLVAHQGEIFMGAAQTGVRIAEARANRRLEENRRRPTENGINPGAAFITKSDVGKMTRADRLAIARRVAKGERIVF